MNSLYNQIKRFMKNSDGSFRKPPIIMIIIFVVICIIGIFAFNYGFEIGVDLL